MPGGGGPIGFVAFAGVKAAGYVGAAYAFKRAYGLQASLRPRPFVVGLARTALGIAVGVSYGWLWFWLAELLELRDTSLFFYYAFLLPVRLGEWSLILWYFFDRALPSKLRLLKYAGYGSGWSYLLDAVAILAAFVVPGGFWIC